MFKQSLKFKTNLSFYFILSIGLSFFAVVLFLTLNLYPKILLALQALSGKLAAVCGCTNHFSFINHPYLFTGIFLAGWGLMVFLIFIIVKIIKLKIKTNRFIKANLAKRKVEFSQKLTLIKQSLNIHIPIIEIDEIKPIVFCFGLLKLEICISSGLVNKLNKEELSAVLAHEQYHLNNYEPLKLFLVKLITKILFFIPGLKYLTNQYIIFSELSADEQATDGFKNKLPLASALYRIIEWEEQIALRNNLALSFFTNQASTDERINKLLNDNYNPRFKIFSSKLLIGLISFIFIFIYFSNFLAYNNSLIEEASNSCLEMPNQPMQVCNRSNELTCDNIYYTESELCQMN